MFDHDKPITEYEDIYGPQPANLPIHPEDIAAHERRFPAAGPPHHTTVPAGVPPEAGGDDLEAEISGAHLRVVRESLGLSGQDLATWLGVGLRTVRRWEAGRPPAWVHSMLFLLDQETQNWADIITRHRHRATIYHDGWRLHDDQWVLPETWWHAVVARAVSRNPGIPVWWAD